MSKIVETKKLVKTYQTGRIEVKALVDVAFSVEKGEFVAIMGASGSGKSTLLHLMGGLDKPTDGEITLRNIELSKLIDKKVTLLRRRNIGFIFQFFNLLPTLTAEENIALPFLIDGKRPREYKEKVDKMLELVGLTERRNHKPDELSGGEQQRVTIARALVTNPAIILADEPTGNLNSKSGEEFLKLLRKSCDEMKQTIVMVTHDAKASAYADRVVFLKDGQIIDEVKLREEADLTPIIGKLKELEI